MTDTLTPIEAAIFSRLNHHPGCEVSYGSLALGMSRVATFHGLTDLRDAIESIRLKTGRTIKEVKGRGYVLDPMGQDSPRAPAQI